MGEATVVDTPPLKIICRSVDATKIFTGPPAVGRAGELLSGSSSLISFSNDGSWMCAVGEETVDLIMTHTMQQVRSLPINGILFVDFSPQANFLVTCQRPMKGVGVSNKNLQVWEVATGKLVWEFHQRSVSDENWPVLHWQDDEALTFHMVTNTIQAHDPAAGFQGIVCKLPLQGVAGFTVSPGINPKIAAYVAEAKGQPASVGIYPVDRLPKDKSSKPFRINGKSFYRVSGVTFLWNSLGSAVLCNSYADVDASNKSYYGEQHLHFMDANSEDSCQVPNLAEGPIHDVQWSPRGDFFAVVAGFMPAKTLLFNANCKPIYDFGGGPHNFIRWNPQGRFLCIAGFGNLPGDIVFWEKKANGKCKKIASVRSPSVSLEWSPSGRHILTAITAPRLRVDNSFKVLTYYGEQIHAETFGELFEANWVPVPAGVFPDRPVSPQRVRGGAENSGVQEESLPSAYVPPHLRGRGGRTSAPQFSLGHSTDQAGRIRSTAQQQQQNSGVPGATFVSKSAQKNARRRAKKSTAKAEANTGGVEEMGHGQSPPTETVSTPQVETTAQGVVELECGITPQTSSVGEAEKRIRTIKKKLRQIAVLKEKMQSQGEDVLGTEQQEKLASEPKLLEELQSLENE